MPTCNRCKSTSVVWGETKAGHPFLVEVRPPIPHSQFCSAQKGKLAKKPKPEKVEPTQAQVDASGALMALGDSATEAIAAALKAPPELTGKEIVLWVLKERNKEGR